MESYTICVENLQKISHYFPFFLGLAGGIMLPNGMCFWLDSPVNAVKVAVNTAKYPDPLYHGRRKLRFLLSQTLSIQVFLRVLGVHSKQWRRWEALLVLIKQQNNTSDDVVSSLVCDGQSSQHSGTVWNLR